MMVWEEKGELVAREMKDIQNLFNELKMSITKEINGNMVFIKTESNI